MRSRPGRTRGLHSRSHRSDNEPMDVWLDVLTAVQLAGAVFFHVRVGSETGSWCDSDRASSGATFAASSNPSKVAMAAIGAADCAGRGH